jgi:hypothetical protein
MRTEREIASWPLECLKTCLRKDCELSFGFFSFSFYKTREVDRETNTNTKQEKSTGKQIKACNRAPNDQALHLRDYAI